MNVGIGGRTLTTKEAAGYDLMKWSCIENEISIGLISQRHVTSEHQINTPLGPSKRAVLN